MDEKEICESLIKDEHIREILNIIYELDLPDVWLCAGSIRNFVWNLQSGKPGFDPQTDVDIVFFDSKRTYEESIVIEKNLKDSFPYYQWEVRNQVYMHQHSPETQPYSSSRDAISKYPETCTAVGVRLNKNQELEVFAPYGWDDILNFVIQPTPHFAKSLKRMEVYQSRLSKKDWMQRWPKLKIV